MDGLSNYVTTDVYTNSLGNMQLSTAWVTELVYGIREETTFTYEAKWTPN